jgi:hypothetical protein
MRIFISAGGTSLSPFFGSIARGNKLDYRPPYFQVLDKKVKESKTFIVGFLYQNRVFLGGNQQ